MNRYFILPFILLLIAGPAYGDRPTFEQWLDEFQTHAKEQGVSSETLNDYLSGLEPEQEILEESDNQAEFSTPFPEYRGYFLTDEMIQQGRELMRDHRLLLLDIERRYGVPAEILVAIWGVESRYGSHQDGRRVIPALATLAYQRNDRGGYFEGELLTVLKLLDRGVLNDRRLDGSWAGALGQPQFMPSSFQEYAVDWDRDGDKNIWTNEGDVLASIANYLARHGWQQGEPWVIAGDANQRINKPARVITPDSAPRKYGVYQNFDVLLRYNQSEFYGLTVGLLAHELEGL